MTSIPMRTGMTRVGLWIDHRKAVIVVVGDGGGVTIRIESNVEKQLRPDSARSRAPYGPQQRPPDDYRETVFMGHLGIFYDRVVACIRDAEAIQVFGPGEAKGELKKRLERDGLGNHVIGVETADKMTDRQLEAQVLQGFMGRTRKASHGRRGSGSLSLKSS